MTHLAKLTFKTVDRSTKRDPIIARRDKLVAGLKEQKLVHAAALKKQDHRVERHKWMPKMSLEKRQLIKTHRAVRPWFFEQDGGWYVQCRYGARVIAADGTNNAVFVKSLDEVAGVLDAFLNAAAAGELDTAITRVAERQPRIKPGAAKAAANAKPDANTAKIAALNDRARQRLDHCRWILTQGVLSCDPLTVAELLIAVEDFDAFTPDNDPYAEHDFGAIKLNGNTFFWKFDYLRSRPADALA